MIEIAKTILDVAKSLFGLHGDFGKARRDRRERLAAYFSELASLIESVGASMRINRYPHGSCAQLQALAGMMRRTVKGIVPDTDARAYQDKLMQVWQIEQLYGQLQSASASRAAKELSRLDEAAGYFRAVAAHLRVV